MGFAAGVRSGADLLVCAVQNAVRAAAACDGREPRGGGRCRRECYKAAVHCCRNFRRSGRSGRRLFIYRAVVAVYAEHDRGTRVYRTGGIDIGKMAAGSGAACVPVFRIYGSADEPDTGRFVGEAAVGRRYTGSVHTDHSVPADDHRSGRVYRAVACAEGVGNSVQEGKLNISIIAVSTGLVRGIFNL